MNLTIQVEKARGYDEGLPDGRRDKLEQGQPFSHSFALWDRPLAYQPTLVSQHSQQLDLTSAVFISAP
jgi:hypothetical protein